MNRLADRLVFGVVQGKSVDEIYLEEQARVDSSKTNAMKRDDTTNDRKKSLKII